MMMMMLQATSETGETQGPQDTVQSLQHEIEVIKAKIAKEREKIRVSRVLIKSRILRKDI